MTFTKPFKASCIFTVVETLFKDPLQCENTERLAHSLKKIDLNTIYTEAEEANERFISGHRSQGDDTKSE